MNTGNKGSIYRLVFAALMVSAAGPTGPLAAVLPLKVSDTGRHLVDQENRPFLVIGDTPWSLIVQPEEKDIERYLDDRQRRGFNAIIVNLIEHKFSSSPPNTRSGLSPFESTGDFSRPDPRYFDFAHQVIQKANARGLVVWLAPAYLGANGGDEGFFREMKGGGKDRLRSYGRFVGKRFKDLPNIVWLLGGDYTPDPPDQWTVTELAAALQEEDPGHLTTVHCSPEHSAASVFGKEPWLNVNTVYTYNAQLFRPVLAEYAVQPARPFVLIESTYEGEHNATPDQIRRQAYWAILGGGCGQFFGNNPLWHFDGPGLFPVKVSWVDALDSTGSRDMARLGALFASLPWHWLEPEKNHAVVTDGFGNGVATALTAWTPDGKLSLTYFPSTGTEPRDFVIDGTRFTGTMRLRWFNPASGQFTGGDTSTSPKGRGHRLRTPGDNGTHANDWVLVLEAAAG
jgi:hypothetical protein